MKPTVHILPMSERLLAALELIHRERWEELILAVCNAPTGTETAMRRALRLYTPDLVDSISTTIAISLYKIFRLSYRDVWQLTWTHRTNEVMIQGRALYIVMEPTRSRINQQE
jgi:hypothetical protein